MDRLIFRDRDRYRDRYRYGGGDGYCYWGPASPTQVRSSLYSRGCPSLGHRERACVIAHGAVGYFAIRTHRRFQPRFVSLSSYWKTSGTIVRQSSHWLVCMHISVSIRLHVVACSALASPGIVALRHVFTCQCDMFLVRSRFA